MKKSESLKGISELEWLIPLLSKLQRKKIYRIHGIPKIKDTPAQLTHFYKSGLRFKFLANPINFSYKSRFIKVKPDELLGTFGNGFYTINYGIFTLTRAQNITFEEINKEELALYINRANKHFYEFIEGNSNA